MLAELFAFIERPAHVHSHDWQEGDILYWDNRVLLHHASLTTPGEQSMSYRIGVYDDAPFYIEPDDGSVGAKSGPSSQEQASWLKALS